MTDHDDDMDSMESPLAKEFAEHCKTVQAEIKVKVSEAFRLLREAEDIADKHGVPFRSGISPLSNSYIPKEFSKTKFGALGEEVVCEVSGVWGDYISDLFDSKYGGWLHSAVC